MIGDSEHDAQGAEKLGIRFIGVGYGFGFKSLADISKFRHIGYVHAVSELLPIITQIGNWVTKGLYDEKGIYYRRK